MCPLQDLPELPLEVSTAWWPVFARSVSSTHWNFPPRCVLGDSNLGRPWPPAADSDNIFRAATREIAAPATDPFSACYVLSSCVRTQHARCGVRVAGRGRMRTACVTRSRAGMRCGQSNAVTSGSTRNCIAGMLHTHFSTVDGCVIPPAFELRQNPGAACSREACARKVWGPHASARQPDGRASSRFDLRWLDRFSPGPRKASLMLSLGSLTSTFVFEARENQAGMYGLVVAAAGP